NQPNASELKKQLLQLLNGELVVYLNAMSLDVDSGCEDFIVAVDSIIRGRNLYAYKRVGKSEGEREVLDQA
ncbi:MAG: hypothetical protein ACK5LR_08135, partial [Mangrovibacterium sp.]